MTDWFSSGTWLRAVLGARRAPCTGRRRSKAKEARAFFAGCWPKGLFTFVQGNQCTSPDPIRILYKSLRRGAPTVINEKGATPTVFNETDVDYNPFDTTGLEWRWAAFCQPTPAHQYGCCRATGSQRGTREAKPATQHGVGDVSSPVRDGTSAPVPRCYKCTAASATSHSSTKKTAHWYATIHWFNSQCIGTSAY